MVLRSRDGTANRHGRPAWLLAALVSAGGVGAAPAAGNPGDEGALRPPFACIDVHEDGAVTAHFGYTNTTGQAVTVPAGTVGNAFILPPATRGQPSTFSAGSVGDAVSVAFSGPVLAWHLAYEGRGGIAIATKWSRPCTQAPAMGLDSPWPVLLAAVRLGVALVVRVPSAASSQN